MNGTVTRSAFALLAGVSLLTGCGHDSSSAMLGTSTDRGTLIYDPPFRIASLDAATFGAQLGASDSGKALLAIAGNPTCGVDFYHVEYNTVGGAGEVTTASGALMVPTGGAAACTGPRPIVLYAHSTQTNKAANIADITDAGNTEGALIAAVFAAQGYIVVAPNYAGYDTSALPYHPFLNADQQSKDMIDALTAARTALPHTLSGTTSDSGKLFVTGYSQGGHVAMATHRALQAAGSTVTAAAPMSGPYALEAFVDAVAFGNVPLGATIFFPLVSTSYQNSYKNAYSATTDIYEAKYASGIDTLLPSTTPVDTLIADGKLPQTALFNSVTPVTPNAQLNALLAVPSNPLFALGFGPSNLITNTYRVSYAEDALANPDGALSTPPQAGVPLAPAPQQPLREDFKKNDLRNWAPHAPVLLCGGDQDPTVFFTNTQIMQTYWSALPAGLVTVLDVNAAPAVNDPFAALQVGFQTALANLLASGGQTAVTEKYHSTVAPFCTAAARGFFAQF